MLETLVLKGGRNAQAPAGCKSEIIIGNAIEGRSVFECPRSHAMHERSASNTSQANKVSNLVGWTDWMVTSPTLADSNLEKPSIG